MLKKYHHQTASAEQKAFVNWYYQSFENSPDYLADKTKEEKSLIRDRIRRGVQLERPSNVYFLNKFAKWSCAAAAAIVVIFAGLYFFRDRVPEVQDLVITHMPAIDKAILTSGDGKVTAIADQGEVLNSSLDAGLTDRNTKFNYLSIEIPKGCKYHFKLEDGTEVWLNPGSKMHIPLDYGKNNRIVSLWGEAYFVVQHMKDLPFHVKTDGMDIKDIGTEFKVRAYPSQNVSVTLAKGSIVVYDSASKKNFSLDDMGEQVLLDLGNKTSRMLQVDTAFATSLRNNLFYFDHSSIDQVIQEISRWYNVDFKLDGYFNDIFFSGSIRRDSKLNEVLRILELSNLRCTLRDSTIVLSPIRPAR